MTSWSHKNEKFSSVNDPVKRMKSYKLGQNICKPWCHKWLVSRTHKVWNIYSKKNKQHTIQLDNGQDMNRHFIDEAVHMANKHMKKLIRIISHLEMQIKTTKIFYILLWHTNWIAQWKVLITPNVDEDIEKMHHSYVAGRARKQPL